MPTEGRDYISTSGNVTFAAGEQQKTIQLSIVNDDVLEEREEFFVVQFRVITLAPRLLLGTSEVTVTIEDNDCKTIGVSSA